MSKKIEYTILLMFSLSLMGIFLWQMQSKEVEFTDLQINKPIPPVEIDLSCEVDSDCMIDETVVHCPAEIRCEENTCVTYCVYDDVDNADMFNVSECLDDIDPLSVRDNEYTLDWDNEEELNIKFNIVLACNIVDLSAYYELESNNHLSLFYEYQIPSETEPCLCVRTLTYKVPQLNEHINYEILIHKVEK